MGSMSSAGSGGRARSNPDVPLIRQWVLAMAATSSLVVTTADTAGPPSTL